MKYKLTGKSKVMGHKGKIIEIGDKEQSDILLKKGLVELVEQSDIEPIVKTVEEKVETPIVQDYSNKPIMTIDVQEAPMVEVKKKKGNPNFGKKK